MGEPPRAVERAADDLITNAREVADTTAADEDARVVLTIVTFAGNVACNLDSVGKTYSGNLSKS